jgi:hypothetical protein
MVEKKSMASAEHALLCKFGTSIVLYERMIHAEVEAVVERILLIQTAMPVNIVSNYIERCTSG